MLLSFRDICLQSKIRLAGSRSVDVLLRYGVWGSEFWVEVLREMDRRSGSPHEFGVLEFIDYLLGCWDFFGDIACLCRASHWTGQSSEHLGPDL